MEEKIHLIDFTSIFKILEPNVTTLPTMDANSSTNNDWGISEGNSNENAITTPETTLNGTGDGDVDSITAVAVDPAVISVSKHLHHRLPHHQYSSNPNDYHQINNNNTNNVNNNSSNLVKLAPLSSISETNLHV